MKQLLILFLILSMAINMVASDDLNDDQNRKVIDFPRLFSGRPVSMLQMFLMKAQTMELLPPTLFQIILQR